MKLSSDLIYRFGRAVPGGAYLDGKEGELEIGTELAPVITIPGPQTDLAAFSATAVQRESFQASVQRAMPASTAEQTDLLATFGRGLWELALMLSTLGDFTNTGSPNGWIAQLLDDDGSLSTLIRHFDSANVSRVTVYPMRILFPEDGWQLRLVSAITGVGQTRIGELALLGNRLT